MTVELWLIVISLWLFAGMTGASILYRRGHTGWRWMIVCSIAGPLSLAVVLDQIRFVEPDTHPTQLHATRHHGTGEHVVVALPSTPLDADALHTALDRLGPGEVTVIAAAPFEATGDGPIPHAAATAVTTAEAARAALHDLDPTTVIVPGRLPQAAIAYANDHNATTIVVPRRGADSATLRRLVRHAHRHPNVHVVIVDDARTATPA